ncbi:MAG: alpha-hydroxy-acid oxidizing protein [Gammaproteobacteria bacterium]|nr:alpha-hydroxy-acid oxidizing protein [Gammaproteobacteria bacterium]
MRSDVSEATCIEDLRRMHRRRVPRMFYDYADSGSWTESTYRANEDDLGKLLFRQRVAVDISQRSLRTSMAGQPVSMPAALAPTGLAGMQCADGEIHAARAAAKAGIPFTLSTMSICSIETVADAVQEPFWFQLYVMRDRDYISRLIRRAATAGCSALMLTLDLSIMGQRHKDVRNGLSTPPRLTLRNLTEMAMKPGWSLPMLFTRNRTFGNVVGHVPGVEKLRTLGAWSNEQLDPALSWDDVQWVRDQWPGRFILKGIMDAGDAEQGLRIGADAMVVSNHGGRQLDGAPSTIQVLPEVVHAVKGRTEVWMDGGIRGGQDVVRALALGAQAVLIGRAFLYGLGAGGEAGVTRAIDIIRRELDLTMAFCGVTDVAAINGSILWGRERS